MSFHDVKAGFSFLAGNFSFITPATSLSLKHPLPLILRRVLTFSACYTLSTATAFEKETPEKMKTIFTTFSVLATLAFFYLLF